MVAEFYYWFILLSSKKNEPFGLLFLLTPPSLRTPPLYFALHNAGEEGDSNPPLIAVRYPRIRGTAREDCDTKNFLSRPKKVLVTLIRFICSFFSTARRTNQEALPQLSGFWARRYGRRRGLRNSLRSDSPRPFFLRLPCDFTAR